MKALWLFGVLVLALVAVVGCASAPETTVAETPAGELGLRLDAGGATVDSVGYAITGPSGFTKTGDIDVADSTKISARIGGLPAGAGFTIALAVKVEEPAATCSGSASFDITAGTTTFVAVTVACHLDDDAGGVVVGGDINICPVLDDLSATPSDVVLGHSITLSASAHDSDSGPSPITYLWSRTAGTLTSNGRSATLTCTEPGPVTVTLTVGDGSPDCSDSQQVTVSCSGDAGGSGGTGGAGTAGAAGAGAANNDTPAPAPVPTPFIVLLAATLLGIGARLKRRPAAIL